MFGFVHQWAEQHKQSRHDYKHRQQGKQHSFDQADGHIRADLKLHKHHGNQTTDGG